MGPENPSFDIYQSYLSNFFRDLMNHWQHTEESRTEVLAYRKERELMTTKVHAAEAEAERLRLSLQEEVDSSQRLVRILQMRTEEVEELHKSYNEKLLHMYAHFSFNPANSDGSSSLEAEKPEPEATVAAAPIDVEELREQLQRLKGELQYRSGQIQMNLERRLQVSCIILSI